MLGLRARSGVSEPGDRTENGGIRVTEWLVHPLAWHGTQTDIGESLRRDKGCAAHLDFTLRRNKNVICIVNAFAVVIFSTTAGFLGS